MLGMRVELPVVSLLVLVGGLSLCHPTVWAEEWEVSDPDDIYLGEASSFSDPGVLEIKVVFENIEPYQEILDRDLTEDNAEYWILLEKANRIFDDVLETVSTDLALDLIGEIGSVVGKNGAAPPDITDDAVEVARDMDQTMASSGTAGPR